MVIQRNQKVVVGSISSTSATRNPNLFVQFRLRGMLGIDLREEWAFRRQSLVLVPLRRNICEFVPQERRCHTSCRVILVRHVVSDLMKIFNSVLVCKLGTDSLGGAVFVSDPDNHSEVLWEKSRHTVLHFGSRKRSSRSRSFCVPQFSVYSSCHFHQSKYASGQMLGPTCCCRY